MNRKIGLPRKIAGFALLAMTAWLLFSPTAHALRQLPHALRLTPGQTLVLHPALSALSSTDETLLSLQNGQMQALALGETEMTVNLFGLLPIRKVKVNVEEDRILIPGGHAVGIALSTRGVMVVGVSDVDRQSPARTAGLKAGDVIESINGENVESSEKLISMVEKSGGAPLSIAYRRDDSLRTTTLTPLIDTATGTLRIGAWVRDSTAGVGTLSYFDPVSQSYGALGHAILDADTGKLLSVRMGALMKADIVSVKRGLKGNPGELRGSFLRTQRTLGDIRINTALGIYGKAENPLSNPLYPDGLPVGYQESVQPGPAQILSTVDQNGIRAYDIEITQVSRQLSPSQKSMVIRVTDPALIEKTGGIVQGMSGSPIIQNGRIIGAVTHVFVDDPTHGYGVFIEWMLETEQSATEPEAAGNAA